jgi:uncharacterized membrane protein
LIKQGVAAGRRSSLIMVALIGLLLLLSLVPLSANAQSKTLHWETYDVVIDLHRDGTFTVTEKQAINFTSGSFSEGFAVIPLDRVEDISNIRVFEDDREYRPGSGSPGEFRVNRYSREVEILWWFEPARNEIRNFTLQYDVSGGLRVYEETGREQLWWRAIDTDFAADVRRASLTLNLPSPVDEADLAAEIYTLRTSATSIQMVDSHTLLFNAANIRTGDAFEARAEFPAMTIAEVPAWQAEDDAERERQERLEPLKALLNIAFLALGVLILIGGPVGSYLLWQARGKDPEVQLPIDILREPPDDLPPGVVGVLIDLLAHDHDVIATIVDLAERGVIHIEETQSEIFGIAYNKDWKYRKTGTKHGLRKYERETLDAIFGSKDVVNLSKIRERFSQKQSKVKDAMYEELVEHGYVEKNPQTVRRTWTTAGIVILAVAGALGFFVAAAISSFAPLVWFPVVSSLIVGVLMLIFAQQMPRRTQAGAEAAAKWEAFKRYMMEIERYQSVEEAKTIFSSYLPYAVAFGIERSWVRKFARVNTPAPHWYGPWRGGPMRRPYQRSGGTVIIPGSGRTTGDGGGLSGGLPNLQDVSSGMSGGLQSMSDGLFSMFNEASKVFRPYSSSGGGGSFGGGGFSGGGGSFGGGGGGGSRGFR